MKNSEIENEKIKSDDEFIKNENLEETFSKENSYLEDEYLEKKEKEISEMKDKFLRLQADFANYRRRTENEKSEYLDIGKIKIIEDLIPVIDNFERAIDFGDDDNKFLEGFKLIYKQLMELLEKNDVLEIESLNKKFDPNLHHAVLVEEKDGVEEGIVVEVLQKGYKVGDKVVRPTMVKVSK